MKTYVLWTHYDCEVYVTLHATEDQAWEHLKDGWLDECDSDCGHILEDMSISDIASAVEWHFDELMYAVNEFEVPQEQLTAERVERPGSERMANEKADELLARFRTFTESS